MFSEKGMSDLMETFDLSVLSEGYVGSYGHFDLSVLREGYVGSYGNF